MSHELRMALIEVSLATGFGCIVGHDPKTWMKAVPPLVDRPSPSVELANEEASHRKLSPSDLFEIIEASLAPLSASEEAFVIALARQFEGASITSGAL